MYLCEHCIAAIKSREPLFIGPLAYTAEKAAEDGINCDWCGGVMTFTNASQPEARFSSQEKTEEQNMNEYEKLVRAESHCHTIEVRETATGKVGVANTYGNGVAVFIGADDGSDDRTVSPEEFSRCFEITAEISG